MKTMQRRIKTFLHILLDFVLIYFCFALAFLVRFEGNVPEAYHVFFTQYIFSFTPIYIITFLLVGIYRSMWRYASADDALRIFLATAMATVFSYTASLLFPGRRLPISVTVISGALIVLLSCGLRVIYREFRRVRARMLSRRDGNMLNVLIIGAGDAGSALIREIQNQPQSRYNIVGIVDDNPQKWGSLLHGISIMGDTSHIREYADRYAVDEIIIAIPSASQREMSKIIESCAGSKCKLRIMPRIFDSSASALRNIREINIEDLLVREPVELDISGISSYVKDKVIMVTGGGGSIGSELCRQIMRFAPRTLIIFDINENNPYELCNELKLEYPGSGEVVVAVGSVQEKERVREVMLAYRPAVVFHAAAYKHVPLMEETPALAVKNNVFGTLNVATCADEAGVSKFVLISTDKAVNPTNVMGATKRVAELIVQAMDKRSKTEFVAVRFGNVLGSSGSVVPIFRKQIELGGPVTLTHKDITRYFMTISEAASLVMEAAAMASGGEIFVLDMGEPIRIYDLARNMIMLSGHVPGEDIAIEFVGLRPGEKLHEELVLSEEDVTRSQNRKIFIAHPSSVTMEDVLKYVSALERTIAENGDVRQTLCEILPNYSPQLQLIRL